MAEPRITAAMCAWGRVLAEPRLSPDGGRVAFVATAAGRAALVVVPAGGGPETTVTADPPPNPSSAYGGGAFDWVGPAGDALVYAATDGHLHVVPATGGPPRKVAEGTCPAVSPDGGRVAYLTDDNRHVAVVSLDPGGPWPVRLSASTPGAGPDFSFDPSWSADGEWVSWHEWNVPDMPWDGSRVVARRADAGGEVVVVAGGDGVAVAQPRFSPDGSLLGFLCDAEGWLNLWVVGRSLDDARPVLKEEHEHGEPSWGPGQRSFAWSPDGRRIAFCRNEGGFGRLCLLDVEGGTVDDVARGVHGGLSWVGERLVAIRSGARAPTAVVAYDLASGPPSLLARGPVAGFEAAGLVEPELVSWPVAPVEGEEVEAAAGAGAATAGAAAGAGPLGTVHGRLYRPAAPPEGMERPPLLVWVHGGPTGQQPVAFGPRTPYFVDRGWAVLVPDYRGSTGWGRAYAQALQGQWGVLDVEDTAAGMRAAAQHGWCDPARMVPIGGSAGGFTVLLLLARHPELCAAGVDLFGVTDLFDLVETTHRFEAHYLEGIVGPLPATADRYRDRSPITAADRIQAPLLILQGTADKAVPPAQSSAIAERLRALGRTVELHLYEGEGHGWNRPEVVLDELERVETFLRRHVLRHRP